MDRFAGKAFVSAQMATRDLIQRPVSLHVDLGSGDDRPFPGEIVFVNPEIDPVNGQVRFGPSGEPRREAEAGSGRQHDHPSPGGD